MLGGESRHAALQRARRSTDRPLVSLSELDQPADDESSGTLEQRVERAEAMYRSLVASLPAITYAESLEDGRTLSISPNIIDLLGYTESEWMGDPLFWLEIIHPDDRDRVVESCRVANELGQPWEDEYRLYTRNGSIVWVRDRATLVQGSRGQPLCWQGVMWDITVEKAAEGSFPD